MSLLPEVTVRPCTVAILACLFAVPAAPALAQGQNQVSLDIGVLEAGISYARRLGQGAVSLGGGLRGAWEPWNTFEQSLFEPVGAELFVRVRPSRATQFEIGPSLLRYRWADDCAECAGTFAGLHAAAMIGTGSFWIGPTARYGVLSGGPSGSESGFMWGVQARLQISWGD